MNEGSTGRTVGQVAELVGVSVRALHHYDAIGLVRPAARSSAGYRTYLDSDIERLHQVLLYRELGFPLEEIATLLDDPSVDPLAHLRRQRALLDERIDRLHQMVAAVDKMMETRTMGIHLSPEEQSEIFGDNWLGEKYAAEAEQRWGETDAHKQSVARTASFSKDDWQRVKTESDALEAAFADALREGVPADSERARQLAERFRQHYEDVAPGLAQYTRDVLVANADRVAAHGA